MLQSKVLYMKLFDPKEELSNTLIFIDCDFSSFY